MKSFNRKDLIGPVPPDKRASIPDARRRYSERVAALCQQIFWETVAFNWEQIIRETSLKAFNCIGEGYPLLPVDPGSIRQVARSRFLQSLTSDAELVATGRALSIPLIEEFWNEFQRHPELENIQKLIHLMANHYTTPRHFLELITTPIESILTDVMTTLSIKYDQQALRNECTEARELHDDAEAALNKATLKRHGAAIAEGSTFIERPFDFKSIEKNVKAGFTEELSTVMRFIDVVGRLLEKKYGIENISTEKFIHILHSPEFMRTLLILASTGPLGLVAANNALAEDLHETVYNYFAIDYFDIDDNDAFLLKKDGIAKIRATYEAFIAIGEEDKQSAITGCPALYTQVIKDFAQYVIKLVADIYVPWFCARRSKN